jgi:hypothetical protein
MTMKTRLLFWIAAIAVVVGTGLWVGYTQGDWGTWALTASVLVVAALTLDAMVLHPPRLWISKPDELGYTDLIFYLYDHEGHRVPVDYLLQLHVLLGNTGGKKAVITRVQVTGFKGPSGENIHLPELPKTIGGHHYSTWTSWRDISPSFDRRAVPPPFMLAPNEVLVLRFRGRRGIDWSTKWDLEKLRSYHEALLIEPTTAVVDVTYRWGRYVKTIKKEIQVVVAQHDEYVEQLRQLTSDFTALPAVPEQRVSIE